MADQYIDNYTQKRLIYDITDIYKRPLTDQGIYYQHDDVNMLKGYAMIIGPEDTLYQHGFYFFEFSFPENYPQQPPKVKFVTNDGNTRFHPNLYRNGKVCLSILNTWKGEGWTSCQTIKSVLLTIVSILDEKPLLHEPGILETNIDFEKYNKIIQYKNISHSFLEYISNYVIHPEFIAFTPYIKQYAIKNKNKIIDYVKNMSIDNKYTNYVSVRIYNMKTDIHWNKLYEQVLEVYSQIE